MTSPDITWITKIKKILIPFKLESIVVHSVMLSDVLLYKTKFTADR